MLTSCARDCMLKCVTGKFQLDVGWHNQRIITSVMTGARTSRTVWMKARTSEQTRMETSRSSSALDDSSGWLCSSPAGRCHSYDEREIGWPDFVMFHSKFVHKLNQVCSFSLAKIFSPMLQNYKWLVNNKKLLSLCSVIFLQSQSLHNPKCKKHSNILYTVHILMCFLYRLLHHFVLLRVFLSKVIKPWKNSTELQ